MISALNVKAQVLMLLQKLLYKQNYLLLQNLVHPGVQLSFTWVYRNLYMGYTNCVHPDGDAFPHLQNKSLLTC